MCSLLMQFIYISKILTWMYSQLMQLQVVHIEDVFISENIFILVPFSKKIGKITILKSFTLLYLVEKLS